MEWWEVMRILSGIRRRYRSHFEAARLASFYICCSNGAKLTEDRDLCDFPWEKEPAKEISDEEIEDLIEQLRKENEMLQNKS